MSVRSKTKHRVDRRNARPTRGLDGEQRRANERQRSGGPEKLSARQRVHGNLLRRLRAPREESVTPSVTTTINQRERKRQHQTALSTAAPSGIFLNIPFPRTARCIFLPHGGPAFFSYWRPLCARLHRFALSAPSRSWWLFPSPASAKLLAKSIPTFSRKSMTWSYASRSSTTSSRRSRMPSSRNQRNRRSKRRSSISTSSSPGARSAPPTWAAASPGSLSSIPMRPATTLPPHRADCSRQPTTAQPSRISSIRKMPYRSALSPSRPAIAISSGSAPARPTRATASPSATASTSPPTAASPGKTWA